MRNITGNVVLVKVFISQQEVKCEVLFTVHGSVSPKKFKQQIVCLSCCLFVAFRWDLYRETPLRG